MTLREYVSWVKYRQLRGTLSTPRRLEQAIARACHIVSVAAGLKKDSAANIGFVQLDFMPHEDGYAELNTETTIDDWVKRAIAVNEINSQVTK